MKSKWVHDRMKRHQCHLNLPVKQSLMNVSINPSKALCPPSYLTAGSGDRAVASNAALLHLRYSLLLQPAPTAQYIHMLLPWQLEVGCCLLWVRRMLREGEGEGEVERQPEENRGCTSKLFSDGVWSTFASKGQEGCWTVSKRLGHQNSSVDSRQLQHDKNWHNRLNMTWYSWYALVGLHWGV